MLHGSGTVNCGMRKTLLSSSITPYTMARSTIAMAEPPDFCVGEQCVVGENHIARQSYCYTLRVAIFYFFFPRHVHWKD